MNPRTLAVIALVAVVALVVALTTLFQGDDDDGPPPVEVTTPRPQDEQPPAPPVVADPETVDRRPAPKGPVVSREEAPGADEFDPGGQLVVSGTVTDAATGQPVAEATVELLYPDGDLIDEEETDEAGRYRIEVEDGIPAQVDLRASADGYGIEVAVGRAVRKDERDLTADFRLQRAFAVEGRVVSAKDGTPIEGVDVEVRVLSPLFEDEWEDGESDAGGYYRIEDIETLPRDGLDVWVDCATHVPQVRRGLTLEPGQTTLRVDFELWETLTIRGLVTSQALGQPIEGAEISIASTDPEFIDDGDSELTEEDGTFALELDALPFEGMMILISAEEHSPVLFSNLPAPARDGVIDLGHVALAPGVVVAGYVIDSATGGPVAGGDVSVYATAAPDRDEGEFSDIEIIDENGRFEIALEYAPSDGAELLIEADDHFPLRAPIAVAPGQRRVELTFQVDPVTVLRGVVRRIADKTPVAGARVRLIGPPGLEDDEEFSGRARADGTFRLELPSGDVRRFAVVVEYGRQRFPVGRLDPPAAGAKEIVKEYEVDVAPFGR